jgi:GTP-binding protein
VGTVLYDAETEDTAMTDLSLHGQRFVAARGGKGGLGNTRFKTSTRQAPDFATPGRPGVTRELLLSLKLLADVGFIGFPNAGKSTLLRRVSAARPRVASYPFTTLTPSLGVVERDHERIVVADIPGLIEGASQGAGLGDRFLRHIERTRVLVHLLDVGAMLFEERDLLRDYDAIRNELGRYSLELLERIELVVLNKIDLIADRSKLKRIEDALTSRGLKVMRVSGATSEGVEELVQAMFAALDAAEPGDAWKEGGS